MSCEVLKPGVLSLIQDGGRRGQAHQGMASGGPMDVHAFRWAHALVGNAPDASAIEISLGGLGLRFHAPTVVALTGADMAAEHNGSPMAAWRSHAVSAGDEIWLGSARQGLRAYLTVAGGFEVPRQFGSCATVVREGLGGLRGDGSPLQAGDRLAIAPAPPPPVRRVPDPYIANYAQALRLRLLPAYQYPQFRREVRERMFTAEYTISARSDRMGIGLEGAAIETPTAGPISEPVAFGTVQVSSDGRMIVLMRDRQTIGGYPKLGCVAALDAAALSQRQPGTVVRFEPGDRAQLVAEWNEFEGFFSRLSRTDGWAASGPHGPDVLAQDAPRQ